MTMDELRRHSREVEWAVLQGEAREAGAALEERVRRFRELVLGARQALVRGCPVEQAQAAGIRTLASALLEKRDQQVQ